VFDFLGNLLQQHTDAWICTIVTVLPIFGAFFGLVYQNTRLDVKRKEQRELEKLKQKIQLLQHKAFEESIQNYEKSVFNDARKMFILHAFFAALETYTQQEKPAPPPNSGTLPYLDDPLPVSNTPFETPVVTSIPLQADVLLVTVTEIETKAVLHAFTKKHQHGYERHSIGIKTYYELGTVNDARIFLVQSEMGVGGPGSSLLTVHEGIQALGPSSVIMVGIAFGVDNDKQRIGDVLVSRQLCGYELQRYGTTCDGKPAIISRGDRVTASAKLLDRFTSGSLDWSSRQGRCEKRVHFGIILSGETLVDNIDYRDQLRALEPEAIGGEMEGVGLYTAAQNAKVDWILVKAICDWADGNKSGENMVVSGNGKGRPKSLKDYNQKRAAKIAAQFTMHVLDKTRLV
jgi:nucleoside phosphorylase